MYNVHEWQLWLHVSAFVFFIIEVARQNLLWRMCLLYFYNIWQRCSVYSFKGLCLTEHCKCQFLFSYNFSSILASFVSHYSLLQTFHHTFYICTTISSMAVRSGNSAISSDGLLIIYLFICFERKKKVV